MGKSRSIAGIVGPSLVVIVISELKIWNPTLYDEQIVPLVYLSGVLLFIAGVAIVRSHNIWSTRWPVIITIVGWMSMGLGLLRMFFPEAYLANFKNNLSTLIFETVLIGIGLFLSFKAYWPRAEKLKG